MFLKWWFNLFVCAKTTKLKFKKESGKIFHIRRKFNFTNIRVISPKKTVPLKKSLWPKTKNWNSHHELTFANISTKNHQSKCELKAKVDIQCVLNEKLYTSGKEIGSFSVITTLIDHNSTQTFDIQHFRKRYLRFTLG